MITRRKKVLASTALVAIAGLALAGCSTTPTGAGGGDEGSDAGPIKIGGVFPLTGPAAANGDWSKLGAEIAVEEINAAGGIDGRQVELVLGDDELVPTNSVTEMNRLINQESADIILGPLASDPVLATLPIVKSNEVANIMGAGSEQVTPDIAPFSFSWTMNATTQAIEMVDAAVDQGAESIAILNDAGSQGRIAAEAMRKYIEESGLTLAAEQEMTIQTTDVTPQLLGLRNAEPDAVLLFPVSATDTGRVLQQLDELNWDVPVVGSYGTTFAEQVKDIAGEDAYKNTTAVTYASFSACSVDEVPETTEAFIKKVYEFDEGRAATAAFDGVAQTYDAIYLMKGAIEATGSTDATEIATWIEEEATEWALDSVLVNKSIAPSSDSHFLYGPDALMLVNPGTSVSEAVFERAQCD